MPKREEYHGDHPNDVRRFSFLTKTELNWLLFVFHYEPDADPEQLTVRELRDRLNRAKERFAGENLGDKLSGLDDKLRLSGYGSDTMKKLRDRVDRAESDIFWTSLRALQGRGLVW